MEHSQLINLNHSLTGEHDKSISVRRNSPVHFVASVVFIVIEIHIRFSIDFINILESISIALRDDISETLHAGSRSVVGSIVEAASNVGMVLVVVSLINIR